ncbi:MAG: hypothetical protein HYS41_07240 [Candidatus Omnitrophica bacterium]|nr:hypothetical protein [Candidatus Omnitrophota bacterium]
MRLRFREFFAVALALALAWGLRGQHGHERGAAIVGAMAGLSLAAATGGARWIGAAVIGSLGFAIGGALSYGRFVHLAYEGSWEAIGSLGLIGLGWGGLGCLGLGLGLGIARYRPWERAALAGGLFLVWFLVDRLLWGHLKGPQDLATRELMAVVLLGAWALFSAYVGAWRQDKDSLKLAAIGGAGFGLGFPLAAWVQGLGGLSGLPVDWWKMGEHLIGLLGGVTLAAAVQILPPTWNLPLAIRPWERWLAFVWLLWLLPVWLIANNLDYWIAERALLPLWAGKVVWSLLFLILAGLILYGFFEIRRGRAFVTSWLPKRLRGIFLAFLWITTVIGSSKTILAEGFTTTSIGFFALAALITLSLRPSRASR